MSPNDFASLLPDSWQGLQVHEDAVEVDGVRVERIGISVSQEHGEEVCGAAASATGSPRDRAWFELIERVAVAEANLARGGVYELRAADGPVVDEWSAGKVFPESDSPERWRYAKSNGIALHVDWRSACERALWELTERDRVLRAWRGESRPEPFHADFASGVLGGVRTHAWRASSFPRPEGVGFAPGIEVVGVFGFPLRPDLPFGFGFAARPERAEAFAAASSEALQVLSFLWNEPLPEDNPAVGPTAMDHLDWYQVAGRHEVVRRWLDRGHTEYAPPPLRSGSAARSSTGPSTVGFVDLTPSWLSGGLRVVKAVALDAIPLSFGLSPFSAHLPPELRIHPIP